MRRPSMQPLAARLRSLVSGGTQSTQIRGGGLPPVGPGNSRPSMPQAERDALTNDYKAEQSGQTPPAISTTGQYTDEQVLAFIDKLRQDAWQARWVHEGRFHTNASYYYDKQWEFWDASKQRMSHWRDLDPNPYRSWLVSNLLKPKIRKLVARSLSANNEVLISPKTDLTDDLEAAKSISAIVEHVAAENHEDELTLEIERLRHIVGPVFVKTYVDFNAKLLVPILAPEEAPMGGMGAPAGTGGDMGAMGGMPPLPPVASAAPSPLGAPMGGVDSMEGAESNPYPGLEEKPEPKILGVKEVEGADIKKCLVPWYEALPDPRSHDPKDWEFFIHEQNMTLSEVRTRFPERGMYVAAGLETTQADRESRTGLINNDLVGMMGKHRMRDERVTVQELWHLPCPAFPKGLVAWRAGAVLLWMGEWLYPSLDTLPFTKYVYEEGLDTPWGFSALESARGPMDIYNKCASILVDAANEGDKYLVPAGTGIPADAFRRGRPNEVITYDPLGAAQGLKPERMALSVARPEVYQLMEMARADIAEILEVQPISDGLVPAGVTAAAAIQSLEQNNRQGSRLAIEAFRLAKLRETQIVVKLAKDIYTGEALLSIRDSAAKVSDRGNTERLNVLMDLLAAVPGVEQSDYVGALDQYASPVDTTHRSKVVRFDVLGRGRVDVDVRVTASKDPAQRLATLQDMASKGFFAPESIETTVVLLEAMQLEDTDKLTEMLLRVLTRIQARQERMMQQQSQQAEQQAAMQAQGEQAKAEAATQAEAQKSQIQAQSDALKAQVDSEAKLAQIQAEGQVKAELMRLEAELKLQHEIQMAQVQAEIARENAERGLMSDLTRSEHAAMLEGDEDESEEEGDEPAPRKPRRRRRKKPTLNLEGASHEVVAEEQEELESGDEHGETHGTEGEILPSGEFLRYDNPNHMAIEEALEEQYPNDLGIGPSSGDDTDDFDDDPDLPDY